MRSGKLGAVNPMGGGGCLTVSTRPSNIQGDIRFGMRAAVNATSGGVWSAVLDVSSWLAPGTVLLQHSSDFAVGVHLPLRQQSATF